MKTLLFGLGSLVAGFIVGFCFQIPPMADLGKSSILGTQGRICVLLGYAIGWNLDYFILQNIELLVRLDLAKVALWLLFSRMG